VPDQPFTEARQEIIKKSGSNPFADYQLPHAILKFKQGFGRLIRSKTDRGIVVILDQRIHTKSYDRQFLVTLSKCTERVDRYSSAYRNERFNLNIFSNVIIHFLLYLEL